MISKFRKIPQIKEKRKEIRCLPKQDQRQGDQPKGEKEAKEGKGKEWGSKRSADGTGRKRKKASKQTCRQPPVREGNQEPRQFQQHRSEHDPPRSGQRWKDGGIIHHQKGSP